MDKKEIKKRINKKKIKMIRTHKKNKNNVFLFFLIFLAGALAYFFLYSPFFKINRVLIIGGGRETIASVKHFTNVFAGRNIFLAKINKAKENILKKEKRIESIEIKRKLPKTIVAIIKNRVPVGYVIGKEKSFLFDKEGVIFQEGKGENSLLAVAGAGNIFSVGEKFLDFGKIEKMLVAKNRLKKIIAPRKITRFILINNRSDFVAETEDGWKIYFNFKADINKSLTKLRLLLSQVISASELKRIDYIDLRFKKIYYKEKVSGD